MKIFSLFRALAHRPYAMLWTGQTVSSIGDAVYQVALIWWVVQHTGSALAMGTVLICTRAPTLFFLLLGGAMVDRFPRLRLMWLSDITRGALVALVALLAFTQTLAVWEVYAISFAFGVVDAFFVPAYSAVVPELASPDLLTSANSLTSLSQQTSGIVGPLIGASIVALGGSQFAFAIDALSFSISALCLAPLLKMPERPTSGKVTHGIASEVHEGLRYVAGIPWLWVTIGVACLSNLTYFAPMVALPFLIKNQLKANVGVLGLFYSAVALGAVLGAGWIGHYTSIRRRGLKSYAAWMLSGIMLTVIGWSLSTSVLLIAGVVIGGTNAIVSLIWVNTLQEQVPRDLQGRVYSIDNLGSSLLAPAGYVLGGWVTPLIGPALVFILGGTLQAGLIALGLLHPKVRNLD